MNLNKYLLVALISLLEVCFPFVYGNTTNINTGSTPVNTAISNTTVTSSASRSQNPTSIAGHNTAEWPGISGETITTSNIEINLTNSVQEVTVFPINATDTTMLGHESNISTSQPYESYDTTDINNASVATMQAEFSPTSPIRRMDDDDEEDDDERPIVTTARPTTTTASQSLTTIQNTYLIPISTEMYETTTEHNTTGSTESLPGGVTGTQTQLDANSTFIIILITVCSIGGVFVLVAVVVILHAMHQKRKKKMQVVFRRRHNSVPLERQRSFSNPAYLEHDIDILANRLSVISSNTKGDNYDEIQNTNISVIGNSDLNYHEICIRESKQVDTPKQRRKNIISNAYDYLRFKGMKTFGKSDKTNIVENEVREPADDNYQVSGYGVDFYDHIPRGATGNPVADDQYDHVTNNITMPTTAEDGSKVKNENMDYQDMYPPVDRDMYTQCPVIGTEQRTSL